MKGLSVLRKRLKPPESTTSRKSTAQQSTTALAAPLIVLNALKESADAFPPLKGTVSSILHIIELSQKVKSNKEDCQKLACRVQEILDKIKVAVHHATCISFDLLGRIDEFARALDEIELFMESLCRVNVFKRVLRHKEHEGSLVEFNRRLDDALKSFMLISTIKTEMLVLQQEARLGALSDSHDELSALIQQNQHLQKQLTLLVILFD
jgi:hypothetical protein